MSLEGERLVNLKDMGILGIHELTENSLYYGTSNTKKLLLGQSWNTCPF
jgi:hypothetical protein